MRVAFQIDSFSPRKGGAEAYLASLIAHLAREGIEVAVYSAGPPAEGPFVPYRVPIVPAPRFLRDLSFAYGCARLVKRKRRADVVVGVRHLLFAHVYYPHGGPYRRALEAGLRSGGAGPWRRLTTLLSAKSWTLRLLECSLLRVGTCPRVVAVSRMVRDDFARLYAIPAERIVVLRNGVDLGRFAPGGEPAARERIGGELGLEPRRFLALFVAHNFRLKGLETAVRAVALAVRKGADPHLLVVGRGRSARFAVLARELGVGARVTFAGERDDVVPFYRASDVLMHPTFYDPCSLVTLEALACGLPVITTSCNGAAEVLEEGGGGIVLERPDDPASAADALLTCVDEGERSRLRAEAIALRPSLDLEASCRRFKDLLVETASGLGVALDSVVSRMGPSGSSPQAPGRNPPN